MRLVPALPALYRLPLSGRRLAEPNGLLALGGDPGPARLLMAYQRGIFLVFPWRPDPLVVARPWAVLWPEQFHLSRSMRRFHQRSPLPGHAQPRPLAK